MEVTKEMVEIAMDGYFGDYWRGFGTQLPLIKESMRGALENVLDYISQKEKEEPVKQTLLEYIDKRLANGSTTMQRIDGCANYSLLLIISEYLEQSK